MCLEALRNSGRRRMHGGHHCIGYTRMMVIDQYYIITLITINITSLQYTRGFKSRRFPSEPESHLDFSLLALKDEFGDIWHRLFTCQMPSCHATNSVTAPEVTTSLQYHNRKSKCATSEHSARHKISSSCL